MQDPFRTWLAQQLAWREWTQADFVRRTGFSSGIVSQWMNGRKVPSSESVDRIADVLGADLDMVLALAGHRPNVEARDPDDPGEQLAGMVRRVRWTTERRRVIETALRIYLEYDRDDLQKPGDAMP